MTITYISYIIYIQYITYTITVITKGGRRNERLFFDYAIRVCAGSASTLYSLVEAQAKKDMEKGASDHERARQAERGSRKA